MDFEDMRRQWRSEVDQPLDSNQRQQLQNDVRQRCSHIERGVRYRDFLETAAVPVLLIWIGIAWPRVSTTWPATAGAILLCIWAISVALTLVRTRHQKSAAIDVSFEEFVRQKLQWCDGQIRLLKNVVWWYVLPPLVASSLILWSKAEPQRMPRLSIIWLSMVAFGLFIVRLNQRAAEKHIQPLRDELRRLLEDL